MTTHRLCTALVLAVAALSGCAGRPADAAPDWSANPGLALQLPADARPLPPDAVARLGFARGDTLPGRAEVIAACYSSDGKVIVAADWTGGANMKGYRIWDAESGAPVGEVPTPIRALFGVSLSPDGKRLAWGGNDGVAVLGVSEVATGKVLWQAKGGNQVAFTADGRHVIGGSYGDTIVMFDAATGRLVHTLSEPGRIANSFVLSRDGTTMVASAERKRDSGKPYELSRARVEVWDVATGRLRKVAAERDWNFGTRQQLAVTSNGKIVGYTEGNTLTVVDTDTGAVRWKVENPERYRAWEFIAFAPADDVLITLRTAHDARPVLTTIDLLDAATGRVLRTFHGSGALFSHAIFSPDGRRLVTYGQSVPIRMWDVATGRVLPAYDGHRAPLVAVAMSDDGTTIVSADRKYTLCVWNRLALRRRLDQHFVGSLGLSGNGRIVVLTASPGRPLILDAARERPDVLAQNFVECLAVSRDGTRAALSRHEHGIDLVELPGGKTLRTLKEHPGAVYALSFSSDGKRLLSAARTRPPFEGWEKLRPDGKFEKPPLPPTDDTVRLWDVETGKELRRWEQKSVAAALSADGRVLLAGCDDGNVRRLAADTGEELAVVAAHPGAVTAVAVSADGRRAAASGPNGVLVWDAATAREVRRFRPDHGRVAALVFSADGRRLASAGADGTLLLWDVPGVP